MPDFTQSPERFSLKRSSIFISYKLGLPATLLGIFFTLWFPVIITNEGLPLMAIISIYGNAILGLIFTLLFALGYAGYKVFQNYPREKSLLISSFKYSLTINLVCWSVFIIISIVDNLEMDILTIIIMPLAGMILCTILATFTVGLLICALIRDRIKNYAEIRKQQMNFTNSGEHL
ncbi:MAG: hypothetical protein NVV82_14815 [Sporocytophaga sp.]|nr:hypothetical protein [Sporocytophaga sp.]